jgi:hypothetical protein
MGIYASSNACGTQRVDVVSMGAITAPLASLAHDQLFVARAQRPNAGPPTPIAVQGAERQRQHP